MNAPRTPPRFVPTLTTVVELPPDLPTSENMIDDLGFDALGVPASPLPAVLPPLPSHDFSSPAGHTAMQVSEEDAFRLEEQLLHRVLQRVDLSLEERLTDTVSAAVQRQLDAMLPRLRSEIEGVLRALVIEALAQELSENPGSTRTFPPPGLG